MFAAARSSQSHRKSIAVTTAHRSTPFLSVHVRISAGSGLRPNAITSLCALWVQPDAIVGQKLDCKPRCSAPWSRSGRPLNWTTPRRTSFGRRRVTASFPFVVTCSATFRKIPRLLISSCRSRTWQAGTRIPSPEQSRRSRLATTFVATFVKSSRGSSERRSGDSRRSEIEGTTIASTRSTGAFWSLSTSAGSSKAKVFCRGKRSCSAISTPSALPARGSRAGGSTPSSFMLGGWPPCRRNYADREAGVGRRLSWPRHSRRTSGPLRISLRNRSTRRFSSDCLSPSTHSGSAIADSST